MKKSERNHLIGVWSWLNKITKGNICIIIAIDYQQARAKDSFSTGLSAFLISTCWWFYCVTFGFYLSVWISHSWKNLLLLIKWNHHLYLHLIFNKNATSHNKLTNKWNIIYLWWSIFIGKNYRIFQIFYSWPVIIYYPKDEHIWEYAIHFLKAQ